VLGLFSGDTSEAVLETLTDSLGGLGTARRAPVVEGFFAAGGGTTGGVEAYVDFTPFVAALEAKLRDDLAGILPDPTGLLGLEQGTWLFVSADVFPGTRLELDAQLRIPEGTFAAELADSFEPLPNTLPADLPRDTWSTYAIDFDLGRFYATARAGFERASEEGLVTVDQGLAAAEALSGVDPIVDVIDQLSGLFALYHVLDEGELPAAYEDGFGFLVGLVDGEYFLDAFETLLGAGGIGVEAIELEGAETYVAPAEAGASDGGLFAGPEAFGDGGLSILPQHLLVAWRRATLVRGLRALNRAEGASLAVGSELQGALDENAGAFAFAYAELEHVRTLALEPGAEPLDEESDPFDSHFVLAAHRTAGGFELRIYTR